MSVSWEHIEQSVAELEAAGARSTVHVCWHAWLLASLEPALSSQRAGVHAAWVQACLICRRQEIRSNVRRDAAAPRQ